MLEIDNEEIDSNDHMDNSPAAGLSSKQLWKFKIIIIIARGQFGGGHKNVKNSYKIVTFLCPPPNWP